MNNNSGDYLGRLGCLNGRYGTDPNINLTHCLPLSAMVVLDEV